jgi:hypothetical protein
MPPGSVRRSGRIPKAVDILLFGTDGNGQVFAEETKTVLLSRHGAGILSKRKLIPEQELIIRCVDTNKEGEVRVVGQIGDQPDGYVYGVAFLDPSITLWPVEFPPLLESEKEANRMLLACSSCQHREVMNPNDLEVDVFAIHQGILRYCARCGTSTIWKQAAGDAASESSPPQMEQETPQGVSPVPATRPENRRRDVRAKMNFTAYIRYPGFDGEIVVCENMSRSGFCFRSHKRYSERFMIEVAVPYSPDTPNIFVPAQIVYVQELTQEKLFRCGAFYVRSSKNLLKS